MLITKEVEVSLGTHNLKHFEQLGYIIPRRIDKWNKYNVKRGTKITVKVEDLLDSSNVYVEVKCDCENCLSPNIKKLRWQDYKEHVREDGKYYCKICAQKLFGLPKSLDTRLQNSKTFEQWCIENSRQDILDRWDYELNEYSPNQVSYKTAKKYYFKCPKGIHNSELKSMSHLIDRQDNMGCKKCNSFAQWGIDNICYDFLEKYWDYNKNININPWKIAFKSNNKVHIKCQEKDYHGSYHIVCSHFIIGQRCAYCCNSHGNVHILDSLGSLNPDVIKIWSSKNKNSPFEFTPMSSIKSVWWKCPDKKHNDYKRAINLSSKCNFRCPKCVQEQDESFLQEKVRNYLLTFNCIVNHERNCTIIPKNPKTKRLLPYDNEIIINNKNLIIEVHGIQHYEVCGFTKLTAKKNKTTSEYELHYQKLKDRYKRIFAKKQGYFYLEIPYWTDDKEETWKQLINNIILNIKSNK